MAPSEMLRSVALVRIDVSEELSASIIRVTRTGELGTFGTPFLVTLMMAAISSSETSVLTRATRHNIPEDAILAILVVHVFDTMYSSASYFIAATVFWFLGR
jgi:hypothetical protein